MKPKRALRILFLMMTAFPFLFAAAGPGFVRVQIKEWEVPIPNSRPHDPAVAPDDSLWYTGQQSNTLGRLDPKTGEIKVYRLKTPDSGPHGLVADKEGNIWFTANYKGYIGKLDPRSGEVAEYPMPDPGARDPHSLVFDQKGILWFTVERGNFIGRLTPEPLFISPSSDSPPNN
jgi:virginiamycin B lyase